MATELAQETLKTGAGHAAPIPLSETEKLHESNPNGLVSPSETLQAKTSTDTKTTAPTSTDAAKSLNESNNKIIKELDEEATKTFPQILMEILTDDQNSDTIAWLPHGRSFIIYKKKRFAAKILINYFKATKFTSFTRKLNRWGFTRVTRGPEMGSYFHKMFLRDNPELCLRMSSHSSNRYSTEESSGTALNQPQNNFVMNPAGNPGFMPMGGFPFYGMQQTPMVGGPAGIVSPPNGIGVPFQMNMGPPPTTAAEFSQQNQYINQQLQQLQWQQFQLQQFQNQQIQASQQAAAGATFSNQPSLPGMQPLPTGSAYSQAQSHLPTSSSAPGAELHPAPTVLNGNLQHPPSNSHPIQQQQQGGSPNHPPPTEHASQRYPQYQPHQQAHSGVGSTRQPPAHNTYGHVAQQYQQYTQQQFQPPPQSLPQQRQGAGSTPSAMGHYGSPQQALQAQHTNNSTFPYPQQQSYPQQQQQQQYSPPIHPSDSVEPTPPPQPTQEEEEGVPPLPPPSQPSGSTPVETADAIVDPLSNEPDSATVSSNVSEKEASAVI